MPEGPAKPQWGPGAGGLDSLAVSDFEGPWRDWGLDGRQGLVSERCRRAWNRPIRSLSNRELATLPRLRIAPIPLLAEARERIADLFEDGTELYDGELAELLNSAEPEADEQA